MTVLYTDWPGERSAQVGLRHHIVHYCVRLLQALRRVDFLAMRVLLVHNRYRTSAPSGEDAAVRNEQQMLQRRGVKLFTFDRGNDDIKDSSLIAKTAAAANTIWSRSSRSALRKVLRDVRPDIVHVHNTFSMISPSIYGACKAQRLPVVQTLHNFRFFCPGALLLRDGKPCENCLDKSLLESIRYRCYRGSFAATATLATMLGLHRAIGTYANAIDRYITLTQFGRSKAIKGGVPEHKVVVKPNFVPDPPSRGSGGGKYVVYVGRLLEGKGAETLVAAWRHLPDVKLMIVGDGAQRPQLEAIARRERLNIEFVGTQGRQAVLKAISSADFLIMPSVCYETFGLAIAEAYACGTPVLASRIGSLNELVEEGVTGRKFIPGNAADLATTARAMLADEVALRRMRAAARAYFETHLTEEQNFTQLMQIYSDVITEQARIPLTTKVERRA
jgi:glycosyltransferase involved in cell wall biosynthesis